jgi:hypothetical protein
MLLEEEKTRILEAREHDECACTSQTSFILIYVSVVREPL